MFTFQCFGSLQLRKQPLGGFAAHMVVWLSRTACMRNTTAFALMLFTILSAGCGGKQETPAQPTPSPGVSPKEVKVDGYGRIEGVVTFQGSPRIPRRVVMAADPVCAAAHGGPAYDEIFVYTNSADGPITVGNVFVHLVGDPPGEYPVPSTPVVLDQKGCQYVPRVLGMMAGQKLLIKNSDPTTHNVHSLSRKNNNFNNGQTQGAPPLTRSFADEELMIRVKCDMHPWMTCYVGVLNHSFFDVTDADGVFMIDKVPAGQYELAAWQEVLKIRSKQIIVKKDETVRVDFVFERK